MSWLSAGWKGTDWLASEVTASVHLPRPSKHRSEQVESVQGGEVAQDRVDGKRNSVMGQVRGAECAAFALPDRAIAAVHQLTK
jgi:hypothetical protein